MDQLVHPRLLLVLTVFAAAQLGALSTESRAYLALNVVGAAVLAVVAAYEQQWGFRAARNRLGRRLRVGG